jgi:multisubunit Na+/H+ antiporter MnhG subunit
MTADLNQPSSPVGALASAAKTVTVSVRLFQRQRALVYLLLGFVLSALVLVALMWLAGPAQGVLVLAALQFFVLPFAVSFWGRAAYIKPAQCSFTAQGVCLQASDWQYQVAWQDVATYQVEFSLDKLIGAGYRLKLREVQGRTVQINLLESELLLPDSGLRPDSALAYLSRYIGWHNRAAAAAGQGDPIVYRLSLLSRRTGTVLFSVLGVLLLADLWLRWQHPTTKGAHVSVLFGALATGMQVLGQRQQEERYARYVLALQAPDRSAAETEP